MADMTKSAATPRHRTLADVKAALSECVRDVEHGISTVITRHGKPVAALVPAEDFERLERLRAVGPEGGLASVAGGWEGSAELVAILERTRRTAGRGTSSSG